MDKKSRIKKTNSLLYKKDMINVYVMQKYPHKPSKNNRF